MLGTWKFSWQDSCIEKFRFCRWARNRCCPTGSIRHVYRKPSPHPPTHPRFDEFLQAVNVFPIIYQYSLTFWQEKKSSFNHSSLEILIWPLKCVHVWNFHKNLTNCRIGVWFALHYSMLSTKWRTRADIRSFETIARFGQGSARFFWFFLLRKS